MKYTTYVKIINAVVVDEELTQKQQHTIIDFVRKNHNITEYTWYNKYNVYCVICKKQLNDKPLKFLQARKMQLLHQRIRENYDTHPGSTYGHAVELQEVKSKNTKTYKVSKPENRKRT